MERQTNYTSMEGYELPSGGLPYGGKVDPHVELRSMTARDEMKRLSPSTTPLKTLSDVIEGCLLEKPGVRVYDMCLGDYEYLMQRLRVVTYGNKYKMSVACPGCGELVDAEADLDEIGVKSPTDEELRKLTHIALPRSGKEIELRLLSPRDIDEIDRKGKDMKRRFKGAETDFPTLAKIEASVVAIDGKAYAPTDVDNIVVNLPAMDFAKLLNSIDALNQAIGPDNEIYVKCPRCGYEIKTFFRFGPEFFRPTDI